MKSLAPKKRKFSDQLHGGTKEKLSKNIPRMKNNFFLTELSVFMKSFHLGFVYVPKRIHFCIAL